MQFPPIFLVISWTQILLFGGIGLVVLFIIAALINAGKYMARYKNFYKKLDRRITKKLNGNLLIENIVNKYATDQTNTYKSLRGSGKRAVKAYLDYFIKNLPQLVLLKSFVSPDKSKADLVILVLDESDKVVARWDKSKKLKGLIKVINKYQMLTPMIGFFYELALHIYENASFRLTNHDNGYVLSYDIVRNAKKIKRKQKPVKMTKAEIKAQEKVQKAKDKKAKKSKR